MSAGRGPLLAVDELRGEIFTSSAQPLTAVDDVSFALARGEILALVGESGSGKSMVAAAILGLVDPPGRIVGGSMLFGSRELRGLSDRQLRGLRGDRLAMLFAGATTALNPMLRIDAQMIESLRAHRIISRSAARERCPIALARVGVAAPEECLRAYPNEHAKASTRFQPTPGGYVQPDLESPPSPQPPASAIVAPSAPVTNPAQQPPPPKPPV